MTDLIVFPDAAALVADHLRSELTVHVGSDVPNPRPTEFVTVQRGGGVRHTLVTDAAQLLFEAWAARAEDAMDLIQLVRAHVAALPGQVLAGTPVYRVDEAAGPANLPDPLSSQPRAVYTATVHLRGTTAVGS